MTEAEQVAMDHSLEKAMWGEWIGKNVYISTVTMHYVGRLVAITANAMWIEQASWIPSDGRFSVVLKDGSFDEIEPFPHTGAVPVGIGALITACPLSFALPTAAK